MPGRRQLRGGFHFLFVRKSAMSSVAWVEVRGRALDKDRTAGKLEIRVRGAFDPAEPGAVTSTEARIGGERPVTCQGGHVQKCVLGFGGTLAGRPWVNS